MSISNPNHHHVRLARAAVLVLALLPTLLLLAGLLETPRRPVDPIAVSTVLVIFVISPSAVIVALLMRRFLPPNRPLLRSVSIATVLSLAALVWVGDFWLIGIYAGLKWMWLSRFLLPTALWIAMTAYQWPRSAADTHDVQSKQS